MIIKIAEYTIKEGELEAALAAISAFVAAVKTNESETFYEAYRKNVSLDFIHIMKFRNEEAEEKHRKAPYTATFVAALYPRCEAEPKFTNLSVIE